jgi:hypothetical protein
MDCRFGRSRSSQRKSQASDTRRPWEDQQADDPVTMTMPIALQGGQQLVHSLFGEVLTGAVGLVRLSSTGRFMNEPGGLRNGVLSDHLCALGW